MEEALAAIRQAITNLTPRPKNRQVGLAPWRPKLIEAKASRAAHLIAADFSR
jgi:hypothetical protein